jgi:hypothetical protein
MVMLAPRLVPPADPCHSSRFLAPPPRPEELAPAEVRLARSMRRQVVERWPELAPTRRERLLRAYGLALARMAGLSATATRGLPRGAKGLEAIRLELDLDSAEDRR